MDTVGNLISRVSNYYRAFNSAKLSGAIDVIVIEHPDGTLHGSPFHARFGRKGIRRPSDCVVDFYVNGALVPGVQMKLGQAGVAFFEEERPGADSADDAGGSCSSLGLDVSDVGVSWDWGDLPRPACSCHGDCLCAALDLASGHAAGGVGGDADETEGELMAASLPRRTVQSLRRRYAELRQRRPTPTGGSLRLGERQLQLLRLSPGRNRLTYHVRRGYEAPAPTVAEALAAFSSSDAAADDAACCGVYLWRHDDRLVVSDIDGTVTRTDVRGQLLPMLGRDWSQPSIAQLYSAVAANDYRLVFLSARGIAQSAGTRRLLQAVSQEGATLPDGPVLLSPQSLVRALRQEVLAAGATLEFKAACLGDLGALFPAGARPFWAGFGNRPDDLVAYSRVGVPPARRFGVNPSGELRHAGGVFTSYRQLADVVDLVFPPARQVRDDTEFSDLSYWLQPLPPPPPPQPPPPPLAKSQHRAQTLQRIRSLASASEFVWL